MPRIPDAEVSRLKQAVRLEALAAHRGMALERSGGQEVKARCCFHAEESASLFINTVSNLYHCFGCGAKGDVIGWVRVLENLTFPDAVAWLSACERGEPAPEPQARRASRMPLRCPIGDGVEGTALLGEVARFYHQVLIADPLATAGEARTLLERRRLWYPELIRQQVIGFDDRSLGTRLPAKAIQAGERMRSRLESIGLYRSTGHAHFRGCLTFPLHDAHTGEIVSMYGRRAQRAKDRVRHVNLPGPRRGVWNAAGCRAAADERDGTVILCEAVIDALSFVAHGQPHATACLGVNGFTDDVRDFLKAHARTVHLAFDRDAAGDRAASEVGDALIGMGITVHRVLFAAGQDANAAVCTAADPAEMLAGLLRLAPWVGGAPRVVVPALPGRTAHIVAAEKEAAAASRPMLSNDVVHARPATAAPSFSAAPVAVVAVTAPAAAAATLPAGFRETGPDEVTAEFPPRVWRVRGWRANQSYDRLKVALRVIENGIVWGDHIDLANSKQRQGAVTVAAAEFGAPPEVIKAELSSVWLAVESLQDGHLRAQQRAAQPTPVDPVAEMTPERKAAAAAFLRRPDLLSVIVQHADACGVVGEAANVEVCYLAGISRKLADPLAVLIQASSSAGKSSLQDGVFRFIPPEDKMELTDMTGAALRYMAEDALCHKAVAVAEDEGASNAVYSIKVMQSAGGLRIAAPVKNPTTNELETKVREVHGPVAFFQTSTKPEIDEELQNRCLVLTVDESRAQTAAVHVRQRDLETVAGFRSRQYAAAILQVHHDAQRLLQPLRVFNPYAPFLTFTTASPRTRRDHAKYLRLIRVIAFLRQMQRPLQRLGDGTLYIETTLEDVADGNRLAATVLGRGLDELAPQTRRLLESLRALVTGLAAAPANAGGVAGAVRFTRRQVREHTGMSPAQVHVHLTRLIDLEYVHAHRAGGSGGPGGGSAGQLHELVWAGEGQDGQRFCLGLMDVRALAQCRAAAEVAAASNAPRPVASSAGTMRDVAEESGRRSGEIRAAFGRDSGEIRPRENADSTGECRADGNHGHASDEKALHAALPDGHHAVDASAPAGA